MNGVLKWILATAFVSTGCFVYVASILVGGVHLPPNPGLGILFAGLALVVALGGYWPIRREKKARVLASVVNVVLIWGAASLAYVLVLCGYETIHPVQSSEWGYSEPGEIAFRASYGVLSLTGLVVFNCWIRKINFRSR
jgi:hypothetical protein